MVLSVVGFARKDPIPYVVVSFDTTTAALSLNSIAQRYGLNGRLIPIPRQLSAGCGMAWREPADNLSKLQEALDSEAVDFEAVVRMDQ